MKKPNIYTRPISKSNNAIQLSKLRVLIAENCCNYYKEGCLFLLGKRCYPLEGKRCSWFEDAVLPGVKSNQLSIRDSYLDFLASNNGNPTFTRKCKICGRSLSKHQRLCEECKKNNKKESYKRWREKIRMERGNNPQN